MMPHIFDPHGRAGRPIPRQQDDPNLDNLGPSRPRCPHCGRKDTNPAALRLVNDIMADRDRLADANNDLQLSIFAELDDGTYEPPPGTARGSTFMGVPVRVRVRVEWPEGPPPGFADAAAVRDWARAQLTKLREDRT